MAGVSVRPSRDVTEASHVSRGPGSPMIKTVEFVTISCDPGYEDDLSVSSSRSSSSAAMSSLSDRSMRSASSSPSPVQPRNIVIHEEFEEVVTTYSGSDEDDCYKCQESDEDNRKISLNIFSRDKIEFPELGMDLAGPGEAGDSADLSFTLPAPGDTNWQHNWLFRQQENPQGAAVTTHRMCPPVSMLVPNPVTSAKAQIGNRDFDLVSELSERISVASFDVSFSSSSEDAEEGVMEEKVDQEYQDQEYTIYEQLPVRRQGPTVTRNAEHENLKWISCPHDLTTHEGKILTLVCRVAGDKPVDVAWFRKSEPIIVSSKHWIYRKKDSHFLTIFDIKREDCGNYRMVAFNKSGEIWHAIELTVKGTRRAEHPPEILVQPHSREVEAGERLELSVQVQGYPEPRVEFFKNGARVNCNEKYSLEYLDHGEWTLRVRGADLATGGQWSVTAENSLGSSTRDWRLRVRPPMAPRPREVTSVPETGESAVTCAEQEPGVENNEGLIQAQMENKTENTMALRKTFGQLTDALNITGGQLNETKKLDDEASVENMNSTSPAEVDPAPVPGSLADREHRKWVEAAVSLRNNPYSKENIDKRRLSRSSSFLDNSQVKEISHKNEVASDAESKKIYCGLRSVNAKRYNRDYFIHGDDDRLNGHDLSFSPEQTTVQSDDTEEFCTGEVSEEKDNDSIGDSKHWDSGLGSSSERASTLSVSEGIRKFEADMSDPVCPRGSVDSLISAGDIVTDSPAPALPGKTKTRSRRLEKSASPPPLPSRRSGMRQRKVHYAETDYPAPKEFQDQYRCESGNQGPSNIVNEYDNEDHDVNQNSVPRLPSVKDLAAKFQPRLSPEPKPRKSLMKKKSFDQRYQKGNKMTPTSFQNRLSTNTFARPNHKLEFHELLSRDVKVDTIVECDETEANDDDALATLTPSPPPISAKLRADGVCVSYQVPGPPLISQIDEEEFDKFLTNVRNSCPTISGDSLRRSDTSSATLPVTWSSSSLDKKFSESEEEESSPTAGSSSQDSLLNYSPPPVLAGLAQGPVMLLGENFEPQVMTEECQPCPREYSSPSTSHSGSSTSGSMFYASFIPDSQLRGLNTDEVSIVCNEFTQIETDSHSGQTSSSSTGDSEEIIAAKESNIVEKNWTSTIRLPSLLDFWERRNHQENKFKKYASESNICHNEAPPENGLRKIPRDKNFTSCEDSLNDDSDYSVRSGYEDHIYEEVSPVSAQERRRARNNEESGFFSYENPSLYRSEGNRVEEENSNDDHPDESTEHLECSSSSDRENNVTVIAVDFNNTNNNIESHPDRNNQKIKVLSSVKDLRKLFERDETHQVNNSLTARSVSRQIRNGLKRDEHPPRGSEKYPEQRSGQVHIVYDSRVGGDQRSESPEHSGIPAIPVPVFSSRVRPGGRERGYTSDESRESEERSRRQRPGGARKERIIWA